jgi:hypothetical protein
VFPPFRAPAQFSADSGGNLGRQKFFPTPPAKVAETHPGEVEDLMNQDALELAMARQDFGVQEDNSFRDGGGGQVRA